MYESGAREWRRFTPPGAAGRGLRAMVTRMMQKHARSSPEPSRVVLDPSDLSLKSNKRYFARQGPGFFRKGGRLNSGTRCWRLAASRGVRRSRGSLACRTMVAARGQDSRAKPEKDRSDENEGETQGRQYVTHMVIELQLGADCYE